MMFEFHRWKMSGSECFLKTFSDENAWRKPTIGNKKDLAVYALVASESKNPVMTAPLIFLSGYNSL